MPTTWPARTSLFRSSPTTYISSGSTPSRPAAARKPSGAGFPTAVALRAGGFLHADQVHPRVHPKPPGGVPRRAPVHGDDGHAVRHPVVHPAERDVVVLRTRPAEQDDVGGFGIRVDHVMGIDDVDTRHVLGDLAAVHQEALGVGVAVSHVVRREHGGGQDLVGRDVHARLRQQFGDLRTGLGRGVGEVRPRDLLVRQHPQRLRSAVYRLPGSHQDTVDVEQHPTDCHGAEV